MAEKPPWIKFSPSDWLLDPAVMAMSWAQRGVYFHLLMVQACEGGLPTDHDAIRKLCRVHKMNWPRIWKVLEPQFPEVDGHRANPRMTKAMEPWAKMSAGGKKGRGSHGDGNPLATPSQGVGGDLDIDQDPSKSISTKNKILDTKKKVDGGALRTRPSARGGLGWDEEAKRLQPTEEFQKDFTRVWRQEFSLAEITDQVKAFTRWYARPKQKARRLNAKARHDQAIHNWMEIALQDRKTLEAADATVRKTPEQPAEKQYCDSCRNKLPRHMTWCPELKKK